MKLFTEGVFKPVDFSFIAEGCVHLFEEGYGALCGGRGEGMDKRLFPVQVPCSVNIGFQRVAGDLEANKTLQRLVRIPQR